jgi:2-polyprenyl-6-methoxyphenol hydroxylase-like FAD-dependent oxidoreductase
VVIVAELDRVGVYVYQYEPTNLGHLLRRAHARQNSSSTWSRVYLPLRETVPDAHYRPGMALERVEREGERVVAHFAGGATAEGDLLIAADGNQSTVRRQLLPEVEARYAGSWRSATCPPRFSAISSTRSRFHFPRARCPWVGTSGGEGAPRRPMGRILLAARWGGDVEISGHILG